MIMWENDTEVHYQILLHKKDNEWYTCSTIKPSNQISAPPEKSINEAELQITNKWRCERQPV